RRRSHDVSYLVGGGACHSAWSLFVFNAQFFGLMSDAFTVRIERDLLQSVVQLSGHARMTSGTEGSDALHSAFIDDFDYSHNMFARAGANKRLEPWELQPKHV